MMWFIETLATPIIWSIWVGQRMSTATHMFWFGVFITGTISVAAFVLRRQIIDLYHNAVPDQKQIGVFPDPELPKSVTYYSSPKVWLSWMFGILCLGILTCTVIMWATYGIYTHGLTTLVTFVCIVAALVGFITWLYRFFMGRLKKRRDAASEAFFRRPRPKWPEE